MARKIPKSSTTLKGRIWSTVKLMFGAFLLWVFATGALHGPLVLSVEYLVASIVFVSLGLFLVLGYVLGRGFATEKEKAVLLHLRMLLKAILGVSFAVIAFLAILHEANGNLLIGLVGIIGCSAFLYLTLRTPKSKKRF